MPGLVPQSDGFPPERAALSGPRVVLRAPRPRDQQDRLACGVHPEFFRMLGLDAPRDAVLQPEEVDRWYRRIATNPLGWMVEVESRCVGAAQLHDLAGERARYAVALFDPAVWNRGVGTEVTRLVLWYAFGSLTLHRIDLRVLSSNHRAIRAYEKCGFAPAGLERQSVCIDGEWHDDILMTIGREEYLLASIGWPERESFCAEAAPASRPSL